MADINAKLSDEIDVSSASFVQQGTAVADTSAGALTALVGETGKKVITKQKQREAEVGSKSLLEEFTGFNRLQAIGEEDDALDEQEAGIRDKIGQQVTSGDPAASLSEQQLASIQKTRDELEIKKAGVEQGLLTSDEFRIQAETLFYQTVAMTPGLKQEIAAVMGEFLGIDPRGQQAKVTMEQRKAALKAGRDDLKTLKNAMQKQGIWDLSLTSNENLAMFGEKFLESQRAIANLDQKSKKLAFDQSATTAELEGNAISIRADLIKAEPAALNQLGLFATEGGTLNMFQMTADEIRQLPKEVQEAWLANVTALEANINGRINSLESATGGKLNGELHKNNITARADLIRSILSGEVSEEVQNNAFNTVKLENALLIEAEKNGILRDQSQARQLAAISDLIPGEVLATNAVLSDVVINLLNGTNSDLTRIPPKERNETLNSWEWSVSELAKSWESKTDWDDTKTEKTGQMALRVASAQPDELNAKVRAQLMRLTSNQKFMDRLESVNPRSAALLRQGTLNHQAEMASQINTRILNAVDATSLQIANPDNFYLKKEEGIWMIMPTTLAGETALPEVPEISLGGRASTEAVHRLRTRQINEGLDQVTLSVNSTRQMMSNLIKSRAVLTGVSEAQAARTIATQIGMSTEDVTKPRLPPGFAEEAGVSAPPPTPEGEGTIRVPERVPDSGTTRIEAAAELISKAGGTPDQVERFMNSPGKF